MFYTECTMVPWYHISMHGSPSMDVLACISMHGYPYHGTMAPWHHSTMASAGAGIRARHIGTARPCLYGEADILHDQVYESALAVRGQAWVANSCLTHRPRASHGGVSRIPRSCHILRLCKSLINYMRSQSGNVGRDGLTSSL